MERNDHFTPSSRPVLPWAVVFLASVLALQVTQVRQEREPDRGHEALVRSSGLRAR
jgi:hypothetical protein